jgi:hypothetical protein
MEEVGIQGNEDPRRIGRTTSVGIGRLRMGLVVRLS